MAVSCRRCPRVVSSTVWPASSARIRRRCGSKAIRWAGPAISKFAAARRAARGPLPRVRLMHEVWRATGSGSLSAMRRLLLALILALLLLAPAGARAQSTTTSPEVQKAADALQSDSAYVAPDNNANISSADADRIRSEIRNKGDGPIYVAVFPPGAGEPAQLGRQLSNALRASGVYAIIAGPRGRSFDAGSVGNSGLDPQVAPKLAT